jgi:predicted nucleic acid-binding protein
MEYLFFDTSALVKRYYEEDGSENVDELIEDEDSTVVITSLSIIEATSAFRRKYNQGEIEQDRMDQLLSTFFEEAIDEFVIVPIEESFMKYSFDLILTEDLRTLDSLQLSAALTVNQENLKFISADKKLNAVAEEQGLKTHNPQNAAT